MEEHKSLLVKFHRLSGQTVVANRRYFNPKTCANYQEFLQNIFGIYPDEDHDCCFFMHILSPFLNCKVKYMQVLL